MATDNSPIFLVGVHRSGTTLLRFMLSSHPNIYIPPESDFIPHFFGRAPFEELSRQRVSSILDEIFSKYRFVKEWACPRPDADEFFQMLTTRTPADFLNTLYTMYAQQNGASRWGDKTPIYANYMDLIHQVFPQAKFVHIIRDGRDVALSMLDKWEQTKYHVDIFYAARSWVRRIQGARASGAKLGSNHYYELRYKNLVQTPERELKALCKFLREEYVLEMARPHKLGRKHIQPDGFHAAVRQPPSTSRIGRWQQEMPQPDRRLFQRVAGDLLAELGYPVENPGQMSVPEQVRYAALKAKYKTLQAGRRVLQAAGFFSPN